MTTVAAIDCGTNSIKLLIGDLPTVELRDSRVVRLGQGVDATGRLADEALDRTFSAIEEFAEVIRAHGVGPDRIRFCATSATRDSANAQVFTDGVRERLGVTPVVLSGAEEATLVYDGALGGLDGTPPEPVLVVDIGGGSTELVLGEGGSRSSISMDIGSVRLHERHLAGDPPTAAEVAQCRDVIGRALDECGVDIPAALTVVGTSGSVKTIASGVLGLPEYDRLAFDGASLRIDETLVFCDALVSMTVEQRRALPYMHPGRADVIGAGALIWSAIIARATTSHYVVSEADILHGIARSIQLNVDGRGDRG